MKKMVLVMAALALAIAVAVPARGQTAYCLQFVVQYQMFETAGILVQSDYGTTVLADVPVPVSGGAGVLMGRDTADLWVMAGDKIHHIDGSGRVNSAHVGGMAGLKPASGLPGAMAAGGARGIVALIPQNATDDRDARTRIALYDAVRGTVQTIVEGARRPVLSPNDRRLAYEKLTGKPGVYVAPLEGGKPVLIGGASTVWGWFGDELLASLNAPGLPGLFRVQPDGGGPRPIYLPPGCRPAAPVIAPAGDKMLYTQDNVLYEYEFGSEEPFPLFVADGGCTILAYRWIPATSVAF